MKYILVLILSLTLLYSCQENKENSDKEQEKTTQKTDALPSWNDSENKKRIISFVENSVDENSDSFIPVENRIVTFDNDGTLWAEKPLYFQLIFALNRIQEMAKDHPEWQNESPFKYVLNNDIPSLMEEGEEAIFKIVMTTHGNISVDDFKAQVKEWLKESKHSKFNVEYDRMVYLPMLELIDYLKANNFKVFIVSGGGVDFMRAWAPEVYGIPSEQIIGSSLKSEFVKSDTGVAVVKKPQLDFFDDKEAKPVAIQKHIGKTPVIAVGNSDGDLAMLQFSAGNKLPNLQIYIHHTDDKREYQYDRESSVGRLDKGLDEAESKGWIVVDMKNDWKKIWKWN